VSHLLPVAEFLNAPGLLLDVRSPGEYAQGHIPGAISFPLFTDAERAEVGICYKQEGRNAAVELGFSIAGPKFAGFIATAKQLVADRPDPAVIRLHCWRGGMRSEAVAWVLGMAGFQVLLLIGGYKAYRGWTRLQFESPRSIRILGGMTGTGKTAVLAALRQQKVQVIDLEGLAHHRGSSFGALGMPPQPTNEQFENQLATCWAELDPDRPVWIEAESRRIGLCRIPEAVFQQMAIAPIVEIQRDRAERLALLVEEYGQAERRALILATERIRKHLGGLRTQQAVDLLQQGNLSAAFDLILDYYDRTYTYDLERRQLQPQSIDVTGKDATAVARLLNSDIS
jgi:tRNA 2-selenouridine synthase